VKSRLFLIVWLFIHGFLSLSARDIDTLWHLNIPELTITQSREHYFMEDKKVIRADSMQVNRYLNGSLGELLHGIAPVYVNFYGHSGSTASIFLRGANSSQNSINWNGFPLNSITLGSADLSFFPVLAFDELSMVYAASGSLYGSGNLGGSINMDQQADWKRKLELTIAPEYGSFSDRRISFSGKGGSPVFQTHTFLSRQQSVNNFAYRDTYKYGKPIEITRNNSVLNTVFIQNVFLNLPGGNQLEGGIWYQIRDKEIPAIMGSYSAGFANQQDSTLKMYFKWSKTGLKSLFSLRSAFFSDYMLYTDKLGTDANEYSVFSEISGKRWMGDANYRRYIGTSFSLDAGVGISSLSADVDAYKGEFFEIIPLLYSGLKYRNEKYILNASVRKEFHEATDVPLLIAVGVRREIFKNRLSWRMSYADQFRVPGFNDKYWQPGGNPNLLPEKGWTADTGLEITVREDRNHDISGDVSFFMTSLDNLILWTPSGNGLYWSPKNTREVLSHGLELQSGYHLNFPGFRLRNQVSYSYTVNTIKKEYGPSTSNEGKLLIYRPRHLLRLNTYVEGEKLHFSAHMIFTGQRFTTEDNHPAYAMPSHTLLHLYAGYQMAFSGLSANLQFKVMNLFNTSYQFVRSYPMPGRTYHVTLLFHYNKE
jgi:vitamin B12 transporter